MVWGPLSSPLLQSFSRNSRTADVDVARADVFVDEKGVEAVLTQPMAAPHLVKHVRKHDIR